MKNKYLIIALAVLILFTLFSSVGFNSLIKENKSIIKQKQIEIEILEKDLKNKAIQLSKLNNEILILETEVLNKEKNVEIIKEKRNEEVINVRSFSELQFDSIMSNYKHRNK